MDFSDEVVAVDRFVGMGLALESSKHRENFLMFVDFRGASWSFDKVRRPQSVCRSLIGESRQFVSCHLVRLCPQSYSACMPAGLAFQSCGARKRNKKMNVWSRLCCVTSGERCALAIGERCLP